MIAGAAEFEADIARGCIAAVRRRAHARRQMARQQSGTPEAAICSRLARDLDQVAAELEAARR
jgi:hypothetical protein